MNYADDIIAPGVRRFAHPEPAVATVRLKPVFLPFSGCGRRCLFCAQHLQSGCAPRPLSEAYAELLAWLKDYEGQATGPIELGFYGGTFTALPDEWISKFLILARSYRSSGLVYQVRASSRPDAVDAPRLAWLAEQGLDCLELGIQSFDDVVLRALGRGYQGQAAAAACRQVRQSGLKLGLHLMPGSPGMNEDIFRADIARSVELGPDFVRLHPCLVLAGAELENIYQAGRFVPWSLDRTVEALAMALLELWPAGIRVIRLGLAPEPDLKLAVVAGPWHDCLGLLARSQALFRSIEEQAVRLGPGLKHLRYPRRYGGEIWGHGRALAPAYERLGLRPEHVRTWDKSHFCLWQEA